MKLSRSSLTGRVALSFGTAVCTVTACKAAEPEIPNVRASAILTIDAPINAVWQQLAVDFGDIGSWASGVNHAVGANGIGLNAERTCDIAAAGFGDTRERITAFDPERHAFTYQLVDGLPGFVHDAYNTWALTPTPAGQTAVEAVTTMRATGAMGKAMRGFMERNTQSVLEAMTRELKYYVEHGRPHPDKLAAMAKSDKRRVFTVAHAMPDIAPARVWSLLVDDFARVSESNPISPHSEFVPGFTKVQPGAQRYMYKSADRKKYFRDEITVIDEAGGHFAIDVLEAKGYPNDFTTMDFYVEPEGGGGTALTMVFTYSTKPRFLGALIEDSIRRQIVDYAYAIEHHLRTGEAITDDNWAAVRATFPDDD